MSDLDERIRSALDRLISEESSSDVFDRVEAKRQRRVVAHRARSVAFVVSILAVTSLSSFGLLRVFSSSGVRTSHPGAASSADEIAFVRSNSVGCPMSCRHSSHIFVMRLDGTGARQITWGPWLDREPSWSPDGAQLVFRRSHLAAFDRPDMTSDLYVVNADGTGLRRLTDNEVTEATPAWSPDGSKIAYARNDDDTVCDPHIWVMNADGSEAHQVTFDAVDRSPTRNTQCAEDFWLSYEEEGDEKAPPTVGDFGPSWAPDGDRILFDRLVSDGPALFVMNSDGSHVRRVSPGDANDFEASWSPTGDWIVFVSDRSGMTRGTEPVYSLYVIHPDGSGLRQITTDEGTYLNPAWSPDGRKIVAFRIDSSGGSLAVMNSDGTGALEFRGGGLMLAWRPIPAP